jgi:prepilin-type processing-associated H-X9-DG protein
MNIAGLIKQAFLNTADCAIGAQAITAGTALQTPSRGLYVGGGGTATVTFADGRVVTLVGLITGIEYPFSIILVSASGLTASNLVATY